MALLFCELEAKAQFTREVPLKPIYKQGWKYFYGNKRMNSAYALQIPLEALENREINERFRKFKRLQVIGLLAYLPSFVYLFTNGRAIVRHGRGYRNSEDRTYLFLLAGGIGGRITFSALAHRQMNEAIDIYNIQIANKSSVGLSLAPLPRQNILGLSYHFTF